MRWKRKPPTANTQSNNDLSIASTMDLPLLPRWMIWILSGLSANGRLTIICAQPFKCLGTQLGISYYFWPSLGTLAAE